MALSKIKNKDIGSKLKDKSLEKKEEKAKINRSTDINILIKDESSKGKAEKLAWEGLLSRLEPKTFTCKICKGKCVDENDEKCLECDGKGQIQRESDIRAIEMVLSPKFPKMQLNVNASLSDSSTEELLDMIEGV